MHFSASNFSRRRQIHHFILLALLAITTLSAHGQKNQVGTPGNSKDQFAPVPKPPEESPACTRAKEYLQRHGVSTKNMPCSEAITRASDLAMQEWMEEMRQKQNDLKSTQEYNRKREAEKLEQAAQQNRQAIRAAEAAAKKSKKESQQKLTDSLLRTLGTPPPVSPDQTPKPQQSTNPKLGAGSARIDPMTGLQKILDVPNASDVIGKLDLLDQFDEIAKVVSKVIYDKKWPYYFVLPASDAATLAQNPASSLLIKVIGEEGAKLVVNVGLKIDQIFSDAETSRGRKPTQPAKDMFDK